jgi:hypothetical protein
MPTDCGVTTSNKATIEGTRKHSNSAVGWIVIAPGGSNFLAVTEELFVQRGRAGETLGPCNRNNHSIYLDLDLDLDLDGTGAGLVVTLSCQSTHLVNGLG